MGEKMKFISKALMIICCVFFIQGCSSGPKLEGQVEDFITGSPAKKINIIAVTNTNIKEEQNRSRLKSQTNENGVFLIANALKSKNYSISVSDNNYVSTEIRSSTPEEDVTKQISEKIYVAMLPDVYRNGFYVYPELKGGGLQSFRSTSDTATSTRINPTFIHRIPEGDIILAQIRSKSDRSRNDIRPVFYRFNSMESIINGIFNIPKRESISGVNKKFEKNDKEVTIIKARIPQGIYGIPVSEDYGTNRRFYVINVVSNEIFEAEKRANNVLKSFFDHCVSEQFDQAKELIANSYLESFINPIGGVDVLYNSLKKAAFKDAANFKVSLLGKSGATLYGRYSISGNSYNQRNVEFQEDENEFKISKLSVEGFPGFVIGKTNLLYENKFETKEESEKVKQWRNILRWSRANADFKIENNRYVVNVKNNDKYIWVYDPSQEYKNYSFSAEIGRSSVDDNYFGLMFDYLHYRKRGCGFSGNFFFINNYGDFQIGYECNGSADLNYSVKGNTYAVNPGQPNKVRIDHIGDEVSIYLNGVHIFSGKDSAGYGEGMIKGFDYGNIGFYASGKGDNYFDNIKVLSVN